MLEDLLPARRMPGAALPTRNRACTSPLPALLQAPEQVEYRRMEQAFLHTGGMVHSEEMVQRLRTRFDQPISKLARWIVDRDVLSLQWQGRTLLPMFQFAAETLTPRPEVTTVIRELVPALSDWEIGVWFSEPNVWLDQRTPVHALRDNAPAVFDAALAERFLARG